MKPAAGCIEMEDHVGMRPPGFRQFLKKQSAGHSQVNRQEEPARAVPLPLESNENVLPMTVDFFYSGATKLRLKRFRRIGDKPLQHIRAGTIHSAGGQFHRSNPVSDENRSQTSHHGFYFRKFRHKEINFSPYHSPEKPQIRARQLC